jgi:hypothetical protein
VSNIAGAAEKFALFVKKLVARGRPEISLLTKNLCESTPAVGAPQ